MLVNTRPMTQRTQEEATVRVKQVAAHPGRAAKSSTVHLRTLLIVAIWSQCDHMVTKAQRDWVTTHLHPGGEGPSMAILKALAELVILRSHQRHSWPIFLAIIAKAVLRVTRWSQT